MSEINSIANGTFTIGQTSAINFEAGPGISITEPTAGTVRIGNDETVLFDGNITATNSTGSLSEPPSAFNDLRVEWYGENTTQYGLKCNYFHNDSLNFTGLACGGLAQVYENYAMGFHFGMLALTNDKVTLVRQARTNFTTGTIGAFTSGNGMFRLQRIVGLNRISGSNA